MYWQDWAKPGLKDPVKAVRLAAADLFHLNPNAISPDIRKDYEMADKENEEMMRKQLDFSIGNTIYADYLVQGGKKNEAIPFYQRSLHKDSKSNYIRFNLSSVYNSLGKNKEAVELLKEAAIVDPKNGRTFYNLALLYYELKELDEAKKSFEMAIKLGYNSSEVYYNYGLLMQQLGDSKEAEEIFLKGIKKFPSAENLNYVLAYFYIQSGKKSEAIQHIKTLQQLNPTNPNYAELFRYR
jgi:tetratricopeptide (TPR) repeat protein